MSAERDKMIKYLKEQVIPVLRSKGFKGSFPHFRRKTEDRIHLLTFQFDNWGGGFVIELANSYPEGYTTSWGKHVEPSKVTAHDLHPNQRKRIQANMFTQDSSTDDWFRYNKSPTSKPEDVYDSICKDVLSKLRYAQEYWQNDEMV